MKKNNIGSIIFVLIVIGIMIFAGYTIYDNNRKVEEAEIIKKEEENSSKNKVTDIRIGITNFDTINPYISQNKSILDINTLVYESLFTITKDYKLENCLATQCSYVGNNTYIIKILPNANFSNGNTITIDDIIFSINTLKNGNSVYKTYVEHIQSTEMIDATTLRIVLDAEIPYFEYYLTFPIVYRGDYEGQDFYSSGITPVGSGRYIISDISQNSITLSKNTGWRNIGDDNAYIETIILNLYQSKGEEFNAFKISNTDILTTNISNYTDYTGTIGYNQLTYPGREFDFLAFNCTDEILQYKEVRQAISYAIDKENIVSSVFNNSYVKANYPLDYGNYLYTTDNNSSGFNSDQSKKILEDAGWEYASGRWSKRIDGRTVRLDLKLSVQEEVYKRASTADIIKTQLENIGIHCTIEKIDTEKYYKYIEEKNYQMMITGVINSYNPELGHFFGPGNIMNYTNNDMQNLLNSAKGETNATELKNDFDKIYRIYIQDVPFVGLYRDKYVLLTSQNLMGEMYPNNYSILYNIEEWYRK